MKITEGYLPFLGYQTYYRIVGEKSEKKPLLLLHGGPGSTHNYFELLDCLAEDGRQLIMYDQLGCGKSSIPDRPELWTQQTWLKELIALRSHLELEEMHLLGQSWGGMLAIAYLCEQKPAGIASVILSSTLSSSALWAQEQNRLIHLMSHKQQQAIQNAVESNDYSSLAYLEAEKEYMQLHSSDQFFTEKTPEPLRRLKESGRKSYVAAWGPNEFTPMGTLKDFNYTSQLSKVRTPALVISGTNDLSTPLVAKTMYDHLPNATWELFAHSRHMPLVDESEKYLLLLKNWLNQHD